MLTKSEFMSSVKLKAAVEKQRREPPVRCEDLLACPFCGVKPQEHDGDYVVNHAVECFFTQQYAQEMWLVGRRIKQWQSRHANEKLCREAGQKNENA